MIGAERQEIGGIARQAVTKRHDHSPKTGRPETPVNREQRKPLSTSDKGFQEAGERIRTADVQLGNVRLPSRISCYSIGLWDTMGTG